MLFQELLHNSTLAATCNMLWVLELQSKHTLQACASAVYENRQAAVHNGLWQTALNSFLLYIKPDSQATRTDRNLIRCLICVCSSLACNPLCNLVALLKLQCYTHIEQHSSAAYVVLQAPLYPDKAKIFHNSTFVLGYDTAVRLVMPKYYGGHDGMLLQLASMRFAGCSVAVAGRAVTDNEGRSNFKTFEDIEIPEVLTKLVRQQLPDQIIVV